MITIFNRQELIITHSMEEQVRVRNLLHDAGIDYSIKVGGGHIGMPASRRAYTGSFGINSDAACEYRIFVKKQDYEKAKHEIGKR